MYIRVKLLNGFRESLTYTVPDSWSTKNLIGSIIEVPLQKRTEAAYVEDAFLQFDEPINYTVRAASSQTVVPSDPHYLAFIQKLSAYHAVDKLHFFKRIRHFLQEKDYEAPVMTAVDEQLHFHALTPEQQEVVDAICPAITAGTYYPSLLHGVTGSGKTEVYKKLIMHAWSIKKAASFYSQKYL